MVFFWKFFIWFIFYFDEYSKWKNLSIFMNFQLFGIRVLNLFYCLVLFFKNCNLFLIIDKMEENSILKFISILEEFICIKFKKIDYYFFLNKIY